MTCRILHYTVVSKYIQSKELKNKAMI